MPQDTKENVISVTFKSNGDLVRTIEGKDTLVAHYDRETGELEFETEKDSVKYMRQVTAAVGTIENGTKSSGLVIKSTFIKGRPKDKPGGSIPPKPAFNPNLGEVDPARVDWYFKHYPQQAYVKYGVFLDADGEPIRRTVRRKLTNLVDDRSTGEHGLEEANDKKGLRVGPSSWERAPIGELVAIEQYENQMIARRPTPSLPGAKVVLFSPLEVVGGFHTGDDGDGGEEQ